VLFKCFTYECAHIYQAKRNTRFLGEKSQNDEFEIFGDECIIYIYRTGPMNNLNLDMLFFKIEFVAYVTIMC